VIEMEKWESVGAVHQHAKEAVGKKIKDLIREDTLIKYYDKPQNKGWLGNAIESDWFNIPNNSRHEADIPYLNLEIKVTPVRKTKKGWSAKERLVLNIFDFHDEITRTFEQASFLEKASLIELMYYEYKKEDIPPDYNIKAATLFNLHELPKEDQLIIQQDWKIIVSKIKAGKAEELSDSLTTYLGATTKGSKSEKNLTTQPFSKIRAHRRSFTLKGAYMSQIARRILGEEDNLEKIIQDPKELIEESFDDIIIGKFNSFVGMSKRELGKKLDVKIPKKDDKASSHLIAKKMLNLDGEIQDTEEFKKAGISVRIATFDSSKKHKYPALEQAVKILIPNGNHEVNPFEIVETKWEDSDIYEYLSSYKFLFIIFEKKRDGTYFRGAKFWRVPTEVLDNQIRCVWENTRQIFEEGIELTYTELKKPTSTGKKYKILNNLPSKSGYGTIFHLRPSSAVACYNNNSTLSMKLPIKSKWINRPEELRDTILSDYYVTKQAWWFSKGYMYEQVKEFF